MELKRKTEQPQKKREVKAAAKKKMSSSDSSSAFSDEEPYYGARMHTDIVKRVGMPAWGQMSSSSDEDKPRLKKVKPTYDCDEFSDEEKPAKRGGRKKGKLTNPEDDEKPSKKAKTPKKAKVKPTFDDDVGVDTGKITGSGCISVMLAQNFDPDRDDPKGWLMSEKLDGVRCYWNGKTMYTRNGNPFYAPKWWVAKLPEIALDGELWTERDDF